MEGDYQLTTPENVSVDYEIAGLGSRFIAALIDALILLVVQGAIIVSLVVVEGRIRISSEMNSTIVAIVFVFVFALELLYPLLFEIAWNGQTPGKRSAGIRMIRSDGGPITATAVVIRNFLRLIDMLPIYYVIGVITMLIDKQSRRLGDWAAGTIAVKERRDSGIYQPSDTPPSSLFGAPSDQFDRAAITRLSADDLRLVQEFVWRRRELKPEATSRLSFQIANRLAVKLGMNTPVSNHETFLLDLNSYLERLQK